METTSIVAGVIIGVIATVTFMSLFIAAIHIPINAVPIYVDGLPYNTLWVDRPALEVVSEERLYRDDTAAWFTAHYTVQIIQKPTPVPVCLTGTCRSGGNFVCGIPDCQQCPPPEPTPTPSSVAVHNCRVVCGVQTAFGEECGGCPP